MKIYRLNFRHWAISLLVGLLLVFSSPIGKGLGRDVDPVDKQAYFDALADTEVATQTEISTRLLAVMPL